MASWNWYIDEWKPPTKPDIIFKITVDRIPKPKKKSRKTTKYIGDGGVKRSDCNCTTRKCANASKSKHTIHIDL